ncbi:MAG TPA: bacterial transcriptional activator domain-containing protein [Aggregatilineales bacterium]|nr:hypothetical protein [Anaerolineales bacterium]HRE47157.1 bacterial transcriptional activator domain-containing protein [Aggregatilineales bacterium]
MITRDEIFREFWQNLTTKEATNVFHVTKRKIKELLGFDLTTYQGGFYILSPKIDLRYDTALFREYVQRAGVAPDNEAAELLYNALELYHGVFLAPIQAAWAQTRREELTSLYIDALIALARICERDDEKLQALGFYQRANYLHPLREDAIRGLMTIHAQLGRSAEAMNIYKMLADRLAHKLKVLPDPTTTALAEHIRESG